MLFNSHEFILLFLPFSLLSFWLINHQGYYRLGKVWLIAVSLFFYGWWNPAYLWLLVFSIIFNYCTGFILNNYQNRDFRARVILAFGIIINLGLLSYFKYANFFLTTVNSIFNSSFSLHKIILPLAISFFTFQQIAYLVDTYQGQTKEYCFLDYCLFVSFFPQLIAGPIVHHKELVPQFKNYSNYKFNSEDLAVGVAMFSIGLFKKVIIADGIGVYVNTIFGLISQDVSLTFTEAWVGAFAGYLQIYFDFSAYSDMALGTARMFGIKLPLNFNSPYQAINISEGINRWHITLNRFLKNYLALPLFSCMQKYFKVKSLKMRQILLYINIMTTMLLSGLWHGAGWTFVVWGAYLGFCIIIYYLWRDWHKKKSKFKYESKLPKQSLSQNIWWQNGLSWLLTTIVSVISLVFFRASNLKDAINTITMMLNFTTLDLFGFLSLENVNIANLMPHLPNIGTDVISWTVFLLLIVWFAPNTQQLLREYKPGLDSYVLYISAGWRDKLWQELDLRWQPAQKWAILTAIMMLVCVLKINQEQEFIYFQF